MISYLDVWPFTSQTRADLLSLAPADPSLLLFHPVLTKEQCLPEVETYLYSSAAHFSEILSACSIFSMGRKTEKTQPIISKVVAVYFHSEVFGNFKASEYAKHLAPNVDGSMLF